MDRLHAKYSCVSGTVPGPGDEAVNRQAQAPKGRKTDKQVITTPGRPRQLHSVAGEPAEGRETAHCIPCCCCRMETMRMHYLPLKLNKIENRINVECDECYQGISTECLWSAAGVQVQISPRGSESPPPTHTQHTHRSDFSPTPA